MKKDVIKIGLLAIGGGIFAVLICNAQPYVLLAPIMSTIVGQSAHTLGAHKKNVNRLIVFIILIFLVVLPFAASNPDVISGMKTRIFRYYRHLQKNADEKVGGVEAKAAGPGPVRSKSQRQSGPSRKGQVGE